MENFKPLTKQKDIILQKTKKELLLYNLPDNQAFCLNETSSQIWQLCDGQKTLSEISKAFSETIGKPIDESLIWITIKQFNDNGLLENGAELPAEITNVNRREVIRKIGLSTIIALPLISNIIAPTSAAAQSASACVPRGGTATATGSTVAQCTTNVRARCCNPCGGFGQPACNGVGSTPSGGQVNCSVVCS